MLFIGYYPTSVINITQNSDKCQVYLELKIILIFTVSNCIG